MVADVQTAPRPFPVLEPFSKIIYGEVCAAVRLPGQQDLGPLKRGGGVISFGYERSLGTNEGTLMSHYLSLERGGVS